MRLNPVGALVLALLPLAAQAQSPMSAEAFDAATRGKTILYGTSEGDYGAEQYLDGRRVRWSFLDGDCIEGQWYMQGAQICFIYEDLPGAQCWLIYDDAGGMTAEFVEDDGARGPLLALKASREPLYCKGPDVGV